MLCVAAVWLRVLILSSVVIATTSRGFQAVISLGPLGHHNTQIQLGITFPPEVSRSSFPWGLWGIIRLKYNLELLFSTVGATDFSIVMKHKCNSQASKPTRLCLQGSKYM